MFSRARGLNELIASTTRGPERLRAAVDRRIAERLVISENTAAGQFQLGDHRSLEEIVSELSTMGFIPSFCTACYRLGRTGRDFMDLAKPGLIKQKCDPNALSTFQEYLIDFASETVCWSGEKTIARELDGMSAKSRKTAERMLAKVRSGKRDVCC